MKFLLIFLALAVSSGCNRPNNTNSQNEHAGEAVENNEHQALYDEVMKIHDEGMEKMGEIYRLKKTLKDRVATEDAAKKAETEAVIAKLDSADKGMMDWMHHFNPPEDTIEDEAYRLFLEQELEKVKKVRQDIMEALETANEEINK